MEDIKIYDFKKTKKFSLENLKYLNLIYEEFCKYLNVKLSHDLKKDSVEFVNERRDQTDYKNFFRKVNENSLVIEFEVEDIVTDILLSIDKNISLIIVDIVLGGQGNIEDSHKDLSDIDKEVISSFIKNIIENMSFFNGFRNISIKNIYSNKFICDKTDSLEYISYSEIYMKIDENIVGTINPCIPYKGIEKIVDKLVLDNSAEQSLNTVEDRDYTNINNKIKDVKIDMQVEVGSTTIKVSELLGIHEGDVLILDKKIYHDIDLKIGNKSQFKCKLGAVSNHKGIIVTDCVSEEI